MKYSERCAICHKGYAIEVYFYKYPVCIRCWHKHSANDQVLKDKLGIQDTPESCSKWEVRIKASIEQAAQIKQILQDPQYSKFHVIKVTPNQA